VTLDTRRQLKEPEGVRDGRPALADASGHFVVGQLEVFDELLIGSGLVERVQILSLQVFDERLLEAGDIIDRADDRGDRREAGSPGRSVATFASDDLVLAGRELPDEYRLENTDRLDRVDQSSKGLLVELLPRLKGVRLDLIERELNEI
jgi:hypothetical protein